MGDINFANVWPFNEIHDVTSDGQAMVYIPKIYVRNTQLPATAQYAGKWQYSISNHKIDDNWHIHPAFMNNGVEMRGIEIGKYFSSKDVDGRPLSMARKAPWTNIPFDDAVKACNSRNIAGGAADRQGWHLYNIFEHHLIARLMLIEYASGAFQESNKAAGREYSYLGIDNYFCYSTCGIYLDGITETGGLCDNGKGEYWYNHTIYLFDGQGKRTYQRVTDVNFESTAYPTNMNSLFHTGVAGDIFLKDYTKSEGVAMIGEQPLSDDKGYTNNIRYANGNGSAVNFYPFRGCNRDAAFRLARYVK